MKAFFGRIKGLWFVLTSRNFILIYGIKEFVNKDGDEGHKIAYLRRTDYNTESDFYSMKASMVMQFGEQIMDEEKRIGDYKPKTK